MTFLSLCLYIIGADISVNVGSQYAMPSVPPHCKYTATGASIGIVISTAVVTSRIRNNSETPAPKILHRGYRSAYWFATAIREMGLISSLFLKIGTQGPEKTAEKQTLVSQQGSDPENSKSN
ncbi:hypothetical protein V1512DRAFT_250440 [Lipomyces arxii]|uniref:uncharacterized protein n=1 Tax=Lipomyces arxii TaxID=56418 RepID=UPI0034CFA0F4